MSELPSGWGRAEIGDLCNLINGRAFKPQEWSESGLPIIRIQNLNNPASKFNHFSGEFDAKHHVKNGDLLFAWSGTPGTSFGAHIWHGGDAILNQHIFKIEFSERETNRGFLRYAINQKLDELISSAQGGVGLRHVTKGTFEKTEISFPPLAEQTRIAQKLDELLAQVGTLKARINAIPALLKRFRQSVLAAAVSGRLTEERRAQNVGWVDEGSPTTAPASSSLPVGWSSKTAGDICGFITKGTTPSKEKMTAGHGEVPYIKVYNLTFTGALDFSIDPTFVDSSTHSTDLKRSIVKPGDVLMNIVGPPLGKVSIVPATYPEWNINQAIARFRAGDEISAAYLALCLRTEEVLSHAVSRAKATAGQFNLTLEICRELPLPVPPEEEQTEIVRRVEQLFAFADQLESKVQSAKSRIDHLTQSILAKAFRGELVPQDPNDEPASVLLERIKAQRTAAPKAKRGRKASA
ncbi:type I restriction endonuclease subunit S [Pseudomonas stutzeri]|uniref:restriction endonuclease subunit S n=1 Tax=Stutzerimonas TaxID=2901164 RepID=UPI001909EB58|nr:MULTISPECIES: restriction endonuclease subunit S [Stutzerimonas]MBK3868814.1 type I restriction endonuclease subunit S [Stutzerimonas stutzeri]MDL2176214.1 restriction endonuclease subunit S [Stutzerimonas sp. FeSN7]